MTTEFTNCTQCHKECPLNALKCNKGRDDLEQFHTEGKALDMISSEVTEDNNIHDHEGDSRHQHGRQERGMRGGEEYRHGRHGSDRERNAGRDAYRDGRHRSGGHSRDMHDSEEHGVHERGGAWAPGEAEDLDTLLRACGHYMYHRAAGEKSGQGKIMHILAAQKEISQKELQEHLGIQPGSVSEILSKMENKGLLERIKDGEDRRKTIVRITDGGEKHVEEFRKKGKNRDLFSALNDEQKDELKELLKLLLQSWK